MALYYGHYGNDPILLFFPVVVVSDWEAASSCSQPACLPACLPGNIVKAHQRPLPWLNAAPSPRRSAGKDAKTPRRITAEDAPCNNDVPQRWSAALGPLLGDGTLWRRRPCQRNSLAAPMLAACVSRIGKDAQTHPDGQTATQRTARLFPPPFALLLSQEIHYGTNIIEVVCHFSSRNDLPRLLNEAR